MPKRLNRETVVEFVESVLDSRTGTIAIDNKVKKEINTRALDKNNANKLHLNKSRTARYKNAKESFLEGVESKQTHHLNSQTSEGEVSSKQNKLEVRPTNTKISTGFDTDQEDVSGISFKFSQEPLLNSSQDDSFCDVKWDCGSPETIQKVKRWRGQYNAESVKNAVSYFSDIQVKPLKNASSKVGTILHSKELFSLATKSRPQKAKERICKKKPHDVQEMVHSFLQDLTKKNLTGVEETFSSSSVGAATTEVCDIETKVDSHSSADDSCHKETKDYEVKTSADDSCWSDDDLFKDNSFLIEATQNQESGFQNASSKNTNGGPGHFLQPHDNLSHGQSVFNDSSVIPSSCVAEQPAIKTSTRLIKSSVSPAVASSHVFNKPGSVNSLHYCKDKGQGQKSFDPKQDIDSKLNQKHVSAYRLKSGVEYRAKCNESVNKFVNKDNQAQSSFRKYSSFHNEAPKPSQTELTSCNNSLRKTHSFDSSHSKNSLLTLQSQRINVQSSSTVLTTKNFYTKCDSNNVQTPKSHIALLPNSSSGNVDKKSFSFVSSKKFSNPNSTVITAHAKMCSTDDGRSLDQNKITRDKWDQSATGDGFDVSLPDDVLEQLLEPDDVFDSQADIISNEPKIKEHLLNSRAKCNGNKHFFTLLGKKDISSSKSNAAATSPKQNTCDNGNQNDKPSFSYCEKTHLSPVKSVSEVQKKDQMNSRSPPVQTFFKNMLSVSNISVGTNSSTPIKDWKNMATSALAQSNIKDSTKIKGLSDSFMDNAFDDSFLNDEAVFESQILPYLEKVESDAVRDTESQAPATISSSPVECSQEQIEQKRQAAIQKRSLRLSQTKKS